MNDVKEILTLEDFRQACQEHDITYRYADDGKAYRAGFASEKRILEAAEKFSRADVTQIWNDMVDSKIIKKYAHPFYWKN